MISLLPFLLSGALLGAFFFVGLRWTLQRALASDCPAAWFLGSLLLRMSVVVLGFHQMAPYGWSALVTALLGLVLAREAILRSARAPIQEKEQHLAP